MLNRPLAHRRRVDTPTESGGHTSVWVELGAVRCRVSQPSAAERVAARQQGAKHTQPVYVSPSADVRRGDELRDAATGEAWRVTAVIYPSERVYLRADCELIQAEGDET
ncbi:head-tail adaptor protein [Nocardiopsis suaedae]|uniref:Head-tail adaptor protein n=1 Tax=Nocardiopsis suaedae TaxID=3018444 RepID=A0ABT4TNL7_9ACTN|nr:head-tail adaptor protein [Nocardiopsis suaedae]MDA2805707.1 head-tail adaptor protein [Nocardiopsis suaedae]